MHRLVKQVNNQLKQFIYKLICLTNSPKQPTDYWPPTPLSLSLYILYWSVHTPSHRTNSIEYTSTDLPTREMYVVFCQLELYVYGYGHILKENGLSVIYLLVIMYIL